MCAVLMTKMNITCHQVAELRLRDGSRARCARAVRVPTPHMSIVTTMRHRIWDRVVAGSPPIVLHVAAQVVCQK